MPESNTRQPRPVCLHSRSSHTFPKAVCEGSVLYSHYSSCTWKRNKKAEGEGVPGSALQNPDYCSALCHLLGPKVTGPPASPLPLRAEVRFLFALTGGTSGSGKVGAAATFFLPRARPFLDPSGTAFSSSSFTAGSGGFSAPPERRLEARVVTWVDRARA